MVFQMYWPRSNSVLLWGIRVFFCILTLTLGTSTLFAAEPQWIWASEGNPQTTPAENAYFRVAFQLDDPQAGQVEITGDNTYSLWINGERIGAGRNWQQIDRYDLKSRLIKGKNVIAVLGQNSDGPAGVVARVTLKDAGNRTITASTGVEWKTAITSQPMWWSVGFNDEAWKPAHVFGELGKTGPWGSGAKVVAAPATPVFAKKARPAGPLQLLDGDRVIFLGDTLVERAQAGDYIETALTSRFPDRQIVFRNLGWSADTVFGESRAGFGSVADGYLQLKQRLFEQQPSVIILGYGGAAASAGPAGLPGFAQGLETLLNTLEETKATIVVLSPLRQEDLGRPLPDPAPFNENRKLYAQALQSAAESRGYQFVNLYNLLGDGNQSAAKHAYTDNGIHLTDYGYWNLAAVLEAGLGWKPPHWEIEVDAAEPQHIKNGTKLDKLEIEKTKSVRFTATDLVLPPPPEPKAGPVTAKIPGSQRVLKINGLAPGNYVLSIDGQPILKASAADWTTGQSIPAARSPEVAQAEALRQAILAKNQLFFYRWRPQNETYLFGFRKHEQGNNAKEIPMFDPLIAQVEAKIAKLRVPAPHVYVIVPE
jgi:lysophospholipase L1-like esterase